MKARSDAPLDVTLRWTPDDIQPVGKLGYRDRIAYFEFDAAFLRSGLELSPMHHRTEAGLHLPYRENVFDGLHGFLADSLPDGWGRLLVDRRARQLGIEPATLTPIDRLACVGSSAIGALCYMPAIDPWSIGDVAIDLDQLADGARQVLEGGAQDVLAALGKAGGSPGGARPKAVVALNDRQEAIHGADDVPPEYHRYLVKFPGRDDPEDIAQIEMAYAMMARQAGVGMPETRLLEGEAGRVFFASRRFDRCGARRLHVHTASGLLYASFRAPSLDYRGLLLLTRTVTRDQQACRDMFALAAFNVLAHNRDDHARQFSYIMERDGVWKLAPAYDLTFAAGPGGGHTTAVLGRGRNIAAEHLIELGRQGDIPLREVQRIIERVKGAVAKWETFAAACDVSRRSANSIATALERVAFVFSAD